MNTRKLCLALLLPLAAACGSGAPDVSDIKSALDNPTGSVNDKNGVTAAAQRQQANGSATGLGAANPFGGGALIAARPEARQTVNPLAVMSPYFAHVERRVGRAMNIREIRAAQEELGSGFDDCFEKAFAQNANINPSGNDFDMSIDIDFDSCGDDSVSGRLTMNMSGTVDPQAGSFDYEASYVYDQVCMKFGDRVCQDGEMYLEGSGRVPAMGSTNGDFTMEIFAAWKIDTIIETSAKTYTFTNKGGLEMKLGQEGSSSSGSFRMVVFVTLPSGEEVSYTLTISFDDNSGSFSIKGKDGSLTCTVDAAGNGSCTGDLDLEWTEADWDETYGSYGG